MNINEFAKEVHENAVAHGWWEKNPSIPECLCLIHGEVSEALEEYRNGKPILYHEGESEEGKPEGIAVELADVILRTLDLMAALEVDIDAVITEKHNYNKGRPYRHGGKLV